MCLCVYVCTGVDEMAAHHFLVWFEFTCRIKKKRMKSTPIVIANSHGDDVSLCVVWVLCEEAHYTHYAVQRGLINH